MPFLRVLELQVFLAVCDVCQDRWGKVPIVVAILARRLRRDPSQVRRALRELDAQGVFALSPGQREGSYLVLCAAEDTWRSVGARLEARWQGKRAPVDGPDARDGAAAVLTPPPAAPPLPRRPPRRKKSGGAGGGGDGDGPGLFQDRPSLVVPPPAVAPPPPPAPPAPDPARAPTIPAPAPTEPSPPPSSPEPYYYPPSFSAFLADHPDFFLDFEGTNPPVDAGGFVPPSAAPPILVCLDREKFLKDRSSGSSDLDRNLPRPHACEAEGPDGDDDDDFGKSFEGEGDDDGDEATTPDVPQLDHVGSLWLAFGASFPGLNRATAAPRLAAILGWAKSYEEARDYLREQIPAVTSDPKIRAPLAYLAHEPRFHTWREDRQGARSGRVVAFRRGGGGSSPLSAVLGAVLGQGKAPAAPPPSPERAPLVPRLPPAAAEPYTRDPAWQARQVEQARQNAAAAAAGRAALVAAQKIPLTLAADHFGPGARGVRHDFGYAWAWSEAEQFWRRGPAERKR